MNAETTEIARRFVACPGWVWLPGMQAAYRFAGREDCDFITCRLTYIRIGGNISTAACAAPQLFEIRLSTCIPDLDDELTRLGCLAVVRRAWGDSEASVWRPSPGRGNWSAYAAGREWDAPTEEAALLAALEAAPK